jgi:hypothetical protein
VAETDPEAQDEEVEVVEVEEDSSGRIETLARLARGVRRILPGDSDFGDPMSTGGDQASQVLARRIAEISTDRPSILRELGLGTLQVYEALAAGGWSEPGETELTVVFTDLVRFSDWALDAGDTAATAMLREVDGSISPVFAEHGGRIVKRLGDGLMATFLEPEQAVRGVLAAQDALAGVEVAADACRRPPRPAAPRRPRLRRRRRQRRRPHRAGGEGRRAAGLGHGPRRPDRRGSEDQAQAPLPRQGRPERSRGVLGQPALARRA